VAGFDGLERWSTNHPFLTTAHQPFERIGARAVELLMQRLQAGPTLPHQYVMLEAPLSIHGSTQSLRRDNIPHR
jgi:DNA-binding LacI/PurR family transcriptional regulator